MTPNRDSFSTFQQIEGGKVQILDLGACGYIQKVIQYCKAYT